MNHFYNTRRQMVSKLGTVAAPANFSVYSDAGTTLAPTLTGASTTLLSDQGEISTAASGVAHALVLAAGTHEVNVTSGLDGTTVLYIYNHTALTALSLPNVTSLGIVRLIRNFNTLASISLAGCSGITYLNMRYETYTSVFPVLESLDISGCSSLQTFLLGDTYALPSIDFTDCVNLKDVYFFDSRSLLSIDLSNHVYLETVKMIRSMTNLQTVNLSGCSGITDLNMSYETYTSVFPVLESLDISGCSSLQNFFLRAAYLLPSIDFTDCVNLKYVYFLDLRSLLSIDLSNHVYLETVKMIRSMTNLHTVNLSGCSALTLVNMYYETYSAQLNSLTSLDVTGCSAIESFQLGNAPLISAIDVSQFTSSALSVICLYNVGLGETGVDAVLADCLVLATAGATVTLTLTGSGTPSAQGYADKATLISNGWTVTTD